MYNSVARIRAEIEIHQTRCILHLLRFSRRTPAHEEVNLPFLTYFEYLRAAHTTSAPHPPLPPSTLPPIRPPTYYTN